jgi:hypothetical protein
MFPEGEDRSYFLFIKHLGSWADLSQDAIDLDHDLSLAIEVLRTYDAKCSVSGDAVQRPLSMNAIRWGCRLSESLEAEFLTRMQDDSAFLL